MSEASVEAALKDLRKEEGNKRCFECSERGPNYVDMDHNTFVCTSCAGILREFTFKVKGLSMATFTAAEVKALKTSGGNSGAAKIWLAKFTGEKPQPGEKDKIRTFIRDKYASKKWTTKSSKKKDSEEEEEDFEEEVDDSLRKSSKTLRNKPEKKESLTEEDYEEEHLL